MRHRRGTAALGEAGFPQRILRHQQQILPHLAERPGHQRQPSGEFGEIVAFGMPGTSRQPEAEPGRQVARHRLAPVVEGMARADRAAELQYDQARPQFIEPDDVAFERIESMCACGRRR